MRPISHHLPSQAHCTSSYDLQLLSQEHGKAVAHPDDTHVPISFVADEGSERLAKSIGLMGVEVELDLRGSPAYHAHPTLSNEGDSPSDCVQQAQGRVSRAHVDVVLQDESVDPFHTLLATPGHEGWYPQYAPIEAMQPLQ